MNGLHIFILHYEDMEKTLRCLHSFVHQIHIYMNQFRIFVVDNGSPVKFSEQWQPTLADHDVEVIRHDENLFLIEAFNRAMQAHKANYYICAANDTVAYPGLINALLSTMIMGDVGVVSAGTNDMGAGVLHVGDVPNRWADSINTNHVDNSLWGFSQRLVNAIGWPDCEGHTHRACWASNQDFCYRARQANFRVVAVRKAYYWHAHMGGADAEAWAAGRAWLSKKWGAKADEVSA